MVRTLGAPVRETFQSTNTKRRELKKWSRQAFTSSTLSVFAFMAVSTTPVARLHAVLPLALHACGSASTTNCARPGRAAPPGAAARPESSLDGFGRVPSSAKKRFPQVCPGLPSGFLGCKDRNAFVSRAPSARWMTHPERPRTTRVRSSLVLYFGGGHTPTYHPERPRAPSVAVFRF